MSCSCRNRYVPGGFAPSNLGSITADFCTPSATGRIRGDQDFVEIWKRIFPPLNELQTPRLFLTKSVTKRSISEPLNCHAAIIVSLHTRATPIVIQARNSPYGMLMIRCPATGRAIFTGRYIEYKAFRTISVFFSKTHCAHCRVQHEWFAGDALVCDSGWSEYRPVSEPQVA